MPEKIEPCPVAYAEIKAKLGHIIPCYGEPGGCCADEDTNEQLCQETGCAMLAMYCAGLNATPTTDALPAPEPVAWMYRTFGFTRIWNHKPVGLNLQQGEELEPLYPADAIEGLRAEVAEARAECLEQARLLGMSAERELALRARLAEARAALVEVESRFSPPH